MVWWSNYPDARPVPGASTLVHDCANCGNRTEHALYQVNSGLGLGNPLTGKRWISTRTEWMLVCPTCEEGSVVDKEFARGLRQPDGLRANRRTSHSGVSRHPNACASCDTPVALTARFCGSCGRRLV